MRRDLIPQARELFRDLPDASAVEVAIAVVFAFAWLIFLIVTITYWTP